MPEAERVFRLIFFSLDHDSYTAICHLRLQLPENSKYQEIKFIDFYDFL